MLFSKKRFSRSRAHGAGLAFAATLLLGVPNVFAQPGCNACGCGSARSWDYHPGLFK
jgi:hypothetical protein